MIRALIKEIHTSEYTNVLHVALLTVLQEVSKATPTQLLNTSSLF